MNTEEIPFYREVLKRELGARLRRRPDYSLRAFARDLHVAAPKLSQILSGKCGLSAKRAAELAEHIELSGKERDTFLASVRACHARSTEDREQALSLLQTESHSFSEIDLVKFKAVSNWQHFAILELTETKRPVHIDSLPHRLGLLPQAARSAVDDLLKLGLLKESKTGQLRQTSQDLITPTDIPSREIREHHSQILRRAEISLLSDPVEIRDFSNMTFAIDSARINEAKIWIREFRRKFCKRLQQDAEKDRVYSLAIQFFPLDKKED